MTQQLVNTNIVSAIEYEHLLPINMHKRNDI